jgi:hypothetical protein
MKKIIITLYVAVFILSTACNPQPASKESSKEDPATANSTDPSVSGQGLNTLSEAEREAGWQLLFDGQSTKGWHTYLGDKVEGWQVESGILSTPGKQGNLVTNKEFDNFEISVEWKIQEQGNSGIFYYVVEKPAYKHMHETGPEFQIIDDENYPQELTDSQKTGANSDVIAPTTFAAKAPGSWNHTRILVNNGQVEHWLNGEMVLEYNLKSPEWKSLVAKSKFATFDYAKVHKGKIGIQDHGGPVAFRNIKVREL